MRTGHGVSARSCLPSTAPPPSDSRCLDPFPINRPTLRVCMGEFSKNPPSNAAASNAIRTCAGERDRVGIYVNIRGDLCAAGWLRKFSAVRSSDALSYALASRQIHRRSGKIVRLGTGEKEETFGIFSRRCVFVSMFRRAINRSSKLRVHARIRYPLNIKRRIIPLPIISSVICMRAHT